MKTLMLNATALLRPCMMLPRTGAPPSHPNRKRPDHTTLDLRLLISVIHSIDFVAGPYPLS